MGSLQGETCLPLFCIVFGDFFGRRRGKCDVMRHIEVELSSPTPEAWLEISSLFWPVPLVLLSCAKLGAKALPQAAPISKTGRGITGQAHTYKPSEQGLASGQTHLSRSQICRRYQHSRSLPQLGTLPAWLCPKSEPLGYSVEWLQHPPPNPSRTLLDTQTPPPGAEIIQKEGLCRHFF